MTLDEAIKHCLEVAEENDLAAGMYEILAENNHNAYERLTAETNSSRCAECAADHRQLAEWLTELRDRQWVSCKDRMPEIIDNISSADVLIHLENGEQYAAVLIGEDNENWIQAYWSTSDMHRDFECDEVTHWQPLPEPPKEDGKDG